MAFPQTPLDVLVELFLGGAWVDVTADVYLRDLIHITRGRSDKAARVDPSTCVLTLNNRSGKYSSRNPTGVYYGQLGRNTPIRVTVDGSVRFTGEVAAWPQRWDVSGKDVWTPIEAAGIMRRLGQGSPVVQSAPRRWIPTTDNLVAYYPLSDPDGSDSAAAIVGVENLKTTTSVSTGLFARQGWGQGNLAPWLEPVVSRRVTSDGLHQNVLVGDVVSTDLSSFTIDIMQAITKNTRDQTIFMFMKEFGPIGIDPKAFSIEFQPNADEIELNVAGGIAWVISNVRMYDDAPHHVRVKITDNGSNIDWQVWLDGVSLDNDTWPSMGLNFTKEIRLNDGDTAITTPAAGNVIQGHLAVWQGTPPAIADAVIVAFGHTGELTGRRIERLCQEDNIPFGTLNDLDDTLPLGPQRAAGVLALLEDAADADGGVLFEPRQVIHAVGNFDNGTLEGWAPGGSVPPTLALSTVRAFTGDTSALITWGTGGVLPLVDSGFLPFTFTPGFEYTATVRVWVPAGDPDVLLVCAGLAFGSVVTTKDAWTESTLTFTANADEHVLQIWPNSAPTSGDQCWFDDVRIGTDRAGLAYRTRASRQNQDAALVLDYEGGDVSPPLELVEDDDAVLNDVTVSRRDSTADFRHTLDDGPLSTQPPPDGVGRYDAKYVLNLESDSQSLDQAGWRVRFGTWDEPRYPVLHVDLAAAPSLIADATQVDVGDRITITNPPAWLPPGPIELQAEGYTETIGLYDWDLEFNCTPDGPWVVGVLDDDELGKLDTSGSELNAGTNSVATTFTVATTDGPVWVTDPAEFPFDVRCGGERMTVTDIDALAVSFVAAGVAAHAVNASVTPGRPAGLAVGDLLLILAAIRASGSSEPNIPAGYELLVDASNMRLFGKRAEAADLLADPTITFSVSVANADTSAQMAAFRGVDFSAFWGGAQQLNGSAQDIVTPDFNTPPFAQAFVIYAGWKQDDWTSVDIVTVDATEIGEPDTTTGDDQGIVWDFRVIANVGPAGIGTRTFLVTGGASAISRGAVAVFVPQVQTFTVTRSVNGVVKSHAAGTPVSLWTPLVLAL